METASKRNASSAESAIGSIDAKHGIDKMKRGKSLSNRIPHVGGLLLAVFASVVTVLSGGSRARPLSDRFRA